MQTVGYSEQHSTSRSNFNQVEQKVAFFEKEGFVGLFTLGQTSSPVALCHGMSQAIGEDLDQAQEPFARPDVEVRGFSGNLLPCIVARGEDSHQLNLLKELPDNS